MTEIAKVFIVDDHPMIVEGLVQMITLTRRYEVSGTANDFEEAMSRMEEVTPDLAIIDLSLPGKNGIDLIMEMRNRLPDVKIIVFSMYDELSFAPKVLRAGVRSYVMKSAAPREIITALDEVAAGRNYVSEAVKDLIFKNFVLNHSDADGLANHLALTLQEQSIFRLIGQGWSSSQIGEKLCISVKTVQTHKDNIKRKLKINTAGELYRQAFLWVKDNPQPTL